MTHSEFEKPFFAKHMSLPAKLAFYQLADGRQSVAICAANLPNLEERCLNYKAEWDALFPDNPITFVALQDVEFPS